MVGRRLVILVAILMGLTALAASVAPPPESPRRNGSTPTATPSPTPSEPAGTRRVEATLDAQDRRVTVQQGDTLGLEVHADDVGAVEIEGLSEIAAVDPDSPARFELAADAPGTYPVTLIDEQRRTLGKLVITAR